MKVTIVDSVSPIKNLKIPQLGPLTIYNVIKEEHDVTYISLSMLSVDKCSELSKRLEDNIPFYGKRFLKARRMRYLFTVCAIHSYLRC